MPLVALAAKLRAIALSEISQLLNETLPYLRLRVSPAGLPATPRLGVQRNFARLGRAQRLLLPGKLEFVGLLARVSERNLKARTTGDITIASGAAASAAKPLVLV